MSSKQREKTVLKPQPGNPQNFLPLSLPALAVNMTAVTWEDPFSVYLKVAQPGSFILESVSGTAKTARWSLIGYAPFLIFQAKDNFVNIKTKTNTMISQEPPFSFFKKLFRQLADSFANANCFPLNRLGLVGYLSYDLNRQFERINVWQKDDLNLPDMSFLACSRFFLFDHKQKKSWFILIEPKDKILNIQQELALIEQQKPVNLTLTRQKINWQSNCSKAQFITMVEKAKEYIFAGDIYQVNLSQRLEATVNNSPLAIYARLRRINPSPFAGYFNFGSWHLVSCSPERLLRLEEGLAETRPIAGTIKRGQTKAEDEQLKKALTVDIKERAEHLMLVDLERNDLGRVCDYGSVKVNELMITESYSHVTHIVSNIVGRLNKKKDQFSLVKACFPGGTITGCPKIRAMEIIAELEPVRRGPYTGSMGYFSFGGNLDLNIIIRTLIVIGQKAYVQAGAGIVADSRPEKEYYETLYKAEALLKAASS